MDEHATKLSDKELEEALIRLQAGQGPFDSPEMLRRLGDTLVDRLWLNDNAPGESG